MRRNENPVRSSLIGVDPQSGHESVLSNARWWALNALQWLPDGNGIVAIAARERGSTDAITLAGTELWLIPYPSGEPRRITTDASYYREPSISSDGSKLVAVAAVAKVHLSRVPLSPPGPAQRFSIGRYDGVAGLAELRDGRIVSTSAESGTVSLWIMDRDGTGRRQLLRDGFENRYPVAFSGGIAYVSKTPTETDVCVVDENGEGRRVIAREVDESPIAVSPDGESFVYRVNRRLWKISSDGRQRPKRCARTKQYVGGNRVEPGILTDWRPHRLSHRRPAAARGRAAGGDECRGRQNLVERSRAARRGDRSMGGGRQFAAGAQLRYEQRLVVPATWSSKTTHGFR